MSLDPFFASGPSDSGLLDDAALSPAEPLAPSPRPMDPRPTEGNLPPRDFYLPPPAAAVDSAALEESLRETPLPAGFLSRLRRLVDGFGR